MMKAIEPYSLALVDTMLSLGTGKKAKISIFVNSLSELFYATSCVIKLL